MIDCKKVYEYLILNIVTDEHLAEWYRVSYTTLPNNNDWDAFVIGLCTIGKNEPLTIEEFRRLKDIFIDCHE